VLTDGVALSPAPDMLFQLISYLTGGERKQKARRLAAGEDPDGDGGALDVLAALHKFPGIRPDPEAFIEALDPLQPRVYSISSSLKSDPGRVSLTVDAVRYEVDKRTRLGVCSTFLGGPIAPGGRLRVYVQKAQHFALPADPSKPIIMIGPGTGSRHSVPSCMNVRPSTHRAATGSSSAISAATTISSMKKSLWRCGRGVAHAADARLVARRRRENLRAASHA
jgi:Sulfite reductase, alpha subunit (flavoprotein)